MDIFDLDETIVNQYEAFARSFSRIRSPELKRKVDELYATRKYWPEPLIQLNPHYEGGGSIRDFVEAGDLEPECADLFRDDKARAEDLDKTLKLRKHQQQAVGYALDGQSFAVTTGTGSGKSLCFFIPIINAAIRARKAGENSKTRAIVIYPMNALANSQAEELRKYLGAGRPGIPTFARYTGQEDTEERERIRDNPPDVLLTNFMMLELLMTRQNDLDRKVIENCRGFQFVVLDELHTYRGRQGADVAMLMRRLRARIGDSERPPVCIGTSATMASEGNIDEKNAAVAEVASKIFGTTIGADAVVTETLRRATDPSRSGERDLPGLAQAVQDALDGTLGQGRTNRDLEQNALAIWIETRVGLKNVEQKPERANPIPLADAARSLAVDSGVSEEDCKTALRNALMALSTPEVNRGVRDGTNDSLFAFKLHRFFSGAGRLYATLRPDVERDVTTTGQIFNPKDQEERLYPVHFCRNCGQEFHPVTLRAEDGRDCFEKREIDDIPVEPDEDDEGAEWGFLMPEPVDSAFNGDDTDYPESWLEVAKNGAKRLKYSHRKHRARAYDVAPTGECGLGHRSWFMPGKYRFCPICKSVSNTSARDINTLASLSGEGRSSATTVLIANILSWMNGDACDMPEYTRKLLAFTDNRQDAALQAGHFNDFIFVTLLRAAILSALNSAESGSIPEPEIGTRIQAALGFLAEPAFARRAVEWMENPGLKGQAREDAEAVLRLGLHYRFWIDQRRGWRFTSPNLEQLGLVRAEYQNISELANDDEEFVNSPVLAVASVSERQKALHELFDHMRTGLAVSSTVLERQRIETLTETMKGQIKSPWSLEDENAIGASVLMLDPPKRASIAPRDEERIVRGTPGSLLARKIGNIESNGRRPKPSEVPDILAALLAAAKNYGIVRDIASPVGGMGWQLIAKSIRYCRQDDTGEAEVTNRFFAGLYQSVSDSLAAEAPPLFGFEGREHTAQVEGELRELREFRFRYEADDQKKLASDKLEELRQHGESGRFLPALFCSPTMELGVDISSMNVVYLRNAPPTAANYAQRSGRAGRSGQAALILTYCAAQSPHDQYFFERKPDLVSGIVLPPSIDLRNRDLIESHLHAEWLAATDVELDTKIPGNLDMTADNRPLLPRICEGITSPDTQATARGRIESVLLALENDFAGDSPDWYPERGAFMQNLIDNAPTRFHETFDRWRDLLSAAERSIETANQILNDYTTTPHERKAADIRRAMGERQRSTLLHATSSQNNDFYLYRYLATEGFLPGYNFPRLPLMAYVPGGSDEKSRHYIQRARFLGISEFGPQSLVYHEGRAFRVDRALLKEAGDLPDGRLTTESRMICKACGAGHPGAHPEKCHVCGSRLGGAILVQNLYRIENVGTRRAERITSNDEDRRRQGFELQTTFSFEGAGLRSREIAEDFEEIIATLDFAQAARISRINRGLRRRKEKGRVGFLIDPKSGAWIGEKKEDGDGKRPDTIRQLIVPMVEDRKNALLLRFPDLWLANLGPRTRTTVTTIQHALARGIEAVFQLEEGEILAEPTPNTNERHAVLFYEAAEGGAGVLAQLVERKGGLRNVAERALEVMHYDPLSFTAARTDVQLLSEIGHPECVAGCYRCILSYFNQPDHEHIDRRYAESLSFLLRLANADTQREAVAVSPLTTTSQVVEPDPEPLLVNGTSFRRVWRHARVVVVDEGDADQEIIRVLGSKGVTVLERPNDPAQRATFDVELSQVLKERLNERS